MTESRTRRLRAAVHRHRVAVAAGTAAVALVAGSTTAAFAATTAGPSPSATPAACAPGVAPLLRALPGSLRTDLKHLRQDTASNKAGDRAAIRAKALSGGYGIRVERVAHIVAGDHGKLAAALPAGLKADLKTLRADPKGSAARRAEAAQIWSKALDGSYGSTFQSLAKDAKTRLDQRCAAHTAPSGS